MQAPQSIAKAATWMAGWLTLMLVIAVAGREAMRELAVFQVMEMRSIIGLLLLWPLVRMSGGWAALKSQRLREHGARNVVHYAAQYAWFAALTMIPLAQVVAIEFTMPIWIILLAAAFLGERITPWKVLAVALGLLGVGLIVRPSSAGLSPGQLVALAAAVGFAVSVTMVKSLTRTDSALAIIFWMLVVQSLLGLLPALWVWRWPSPSAWGWVGLVAFCGTFSHYCMARAMRHAEATVVMPMDYLRVPLTALAGWWIYAERLDLFTVAGTALILGGNLLNLRRARVAAAAA
ncbi:MAG: multidrug transporter permease [Proteobacteria bacterium]|jgi:drug/metabolite transporter (DMT)-like permease|nr:multidrug transporter permease [Pseudomonadota bacterium]